MSDRNNNSNNTVSADIPSSRLPRRIQEEINREQAYVTMLYDRLDALRANARSRLDATHRGPHAENDQAMTERQSFHELYTERLARLSAAERALCFGRLDMVDGTRTYIGRIGLFDDDYEPLLVDWRAPVAQPFYRATPADPCGVASRRHIRTRGRQVIGLEDDPLDVHALRDDQRHRLIGEAALLASLEAPRSGRMSDIVATIQAEQDKVIRSKLDGVLVVEGGPGTGKTVVALHRAAYLLYTYRSRLAERGVLIIGPNSTFLRYIDQVLPSLGETNVVLATIAELYPGIEATGRDSVEAERLKGDARMVAILEAAVRDRQQVPDRDLVVELEMTMGKEQYVLTRQDCVRAREQVWEHARTTGEHRHNRLRPHFVARILDLFTDQAVERLGADLLEEADVADLRTEFATSPTVRELLDELWPELTPERFLTELFASPERLKAAAPDLSDAERAALLRAPGSPWTPADVALLDEAAELLGELDVTIRSSHDAGVRQLHAEAEDFAYAYQTARLQMEYEHLPATPDDLEAVAEMVAERYREASKGGDTTDAALVDRTRTYGHVIVDEAQELSAMQWRMVLRRCPSRSMTIVGDLAQASSPGGVARWEEALEPYVSGRWRRERLTINYRTPAEIMQVADGVLAAVDPTLSSPRSVRSGPVPWYCCVESHGQQDTSPDSGLGDTAEDVADKLADTVAAHVARELQELAEIGMDADGESDSDTSAAAAGSGRLAVIVPLSRLDEVTRALQAFDFGSAARGVASVLDSRVSVLTVAQAKGLEFDIVIVVDPRRVLDESRRGAGDLYVAVTRATRRLGVVSVGPLPPELERLRTDGVAYATAAMPSP
jgi:DNA helicase IV